MSTREDSDDGICLLSFDSGGSGTYSQLLIVKEYSRRLATDLGVHEDDLRLADHFDLMCGVGFGGLAALMLGHLRMTVDEAMNTLLTISRPVFLSDHEGAVSPESNTKTLKAVIEDMLRARNIQADTKIHDRSLPPVKCKVVIYAAASSDITQPKIFRTYPHRGSSLNPTIVEVLCATIVSPPFFSPVKFGPRGREQNFVGGPLGANNPTRELLREAGAIYGNNKRVAQIISLGPGTVLLESPDPAEVASGLLNSLAVDGEKMASELSTRLFAVDAYVRLNVDFNMKTGKMDNWSAVGTLEAQTCAYIESDAVVRAVDESMRYLRNRVGSATLGQISSYMMIQCGLTKYTESQTDQASNAKVTVKVPPALSQYFVVREKEWKSMVHHLVNLPTSNQRTFVITGMGGCGKTQMVSYFLQEKGSKYTHSIFIDASSPFALKADLQTWAQSLGDGHEQDVWEDALRMLASDFDGARWILIFDNADDLALDLAPFLPKCYSGTVIITSRNRSMGNLSNTHHMELGEMDKDEALSTLLLAARRQESSLSPDEKRDANLLTEKLGYLAVALVQAGTYCYQLSVTVEGSERLLTFAHYVTIFSSQRADLMQKAESLSLDNYQLGAYAAFDISYKALPQKTKDFLHFVAFFHHSNIPLSMFSTAVQSRFNDPHPLLRRPQEHFDIESQLGRLLSLEGKWNEPYIHGIIRNLRSFSLLSASSTSNMVFLHLHPLVHAWARDMMQSEYRRHRIMVALVLNACSTKRFFQLHPYLLPHFDDLLDNDAAEDVHVNDIFAAGVLLMNLGYHSRAEILFNRSLEVTEGVYERGDSVCIRVATMLANAYHAHGKWKEAEALGLENLKQCTKIYGRNHVLTTNVANNLAIMYASQGRHREAEELYLEMLEHQREHKGRDDPDTIGTANNLATTYLAMGRYDEAEALETEVLGQRRRLVGRDHPDTITAASNLAAVYSSMGRYKEAELLEVEALEQRRKGLGKNHPSTITAANNLAATYSSMGRYKEAESMRIEVLEQREKLFGENHPETLVAGNNLVATYISLGRYNDAVSLALQVLGQLKVVLGEGHGETLNTMGNLATAYSAQGRHREAEELQSEILEQRRKIHGHEHPKTLSAASSLASTYSSLGRYREAEVLETEVLEERRKAMGNNHPDTLAAASNLAVTYSSVGRNKEAELLGFEVLERRRDVLGNDHPDTLFAANNLVDLYNIQGYHQKAEELVTQVLEQCTRVLGKDHPDTLTAANSLAATWDSQDKHKEAEELLVQVLEKRETLLGQRHPDTVRTMSHLAIAYANQGKGKMAELLLIEVVALSTETLGKEHPHTQMYAANLTDVQRPGWSSRYSLLFAISSLTVIVSVLAARRFRGRI